MVLKKYNRKGKVKTKRKRKRKHRRNTKRKRKRVLKGGNGTECDGEIQIRKGNIRSSVPIYRLPLSQGFTTRSNKKNNTVA